MTYTTPRSSLRFSLIVGLAAICLCSCQPQAEPAKSYFHNASVIVAQSLTQYEIERQFAGLVLPAQSTDLGFELAGKISRIYFEEGNHVPQGALMAELDTSLLQADREQLLAQIVELNASLDLNQSNLVRAHDLKTKGFTSEQNIDELVAEQRRINARLEQVKANLSSNQTRLDKSELRAPYAGAISQRAQDQGAVVAAGTPIFRLLENIELEARIGVPVRVLHQLNISDNLQLEIAGVDLEGRVISIGSDVSRATLTVPIRIALPAKTQAIAGDQAYLKLTEVVTEPGYWIPMTALTDGIRGLWNIYVVVPTENPELYLLEARDIKIVHADEDLAYVSGALADGEMIVTAGLQRLVPGQRVRIQNNNTEAS